MSNEYKEWEKDRKEQAWEDILAIAEIVECDFQATACEETKIHSFEMIKDILVKGGWI